MSGSPQSKVRDLIDFDLANRIVTKALARVQPLPGDITSRLNDDFARSTEAAYGLVSAVTGLSSPNGPANARVLDRLAWSQENIASLEKLLDRVGPIDSKRSSRTNVLGRASAGTEIALMFSWLSGRVLGQYNMVATEHGEDAVFYVAPNVYGLERRYGFAPTEFRLWIALHEVTHHLQFTGVPWMRDYFLSLASRATALGTHNSDRLSQALSRAVETVRRGENPLAEGGLATLLAGTELLETLREAQALMSLLEGHAEFVMSRTAPEQIPGAKRFEATMANRRNSSHGVAKFVQQALGFEAKLRQYHEGHVFIDRVLAAGGDELLSRVWQRQENLPTIAEIHDAALWVTRMQSAQPNEHNPRVIS